MVVKRRKLESQVAKDEIRYEWKNFFDLTVVIVESNRPLSVSRIANSFSPEGKKPDIMVLHNPVDNRFSVKPNYITLNNVFALKFLRGLESDLNRSDEAAKYGRSKWKIDMQKGILQSPNHGFKSELNLAQIVTAIGVKQYFREIKKLRNTMFLPPPGQVDATQSMRMALEKMQGEMPIGGKIEVIKGRTRITLGGSL